MKSSVDREIFAVKILSPVALAAKIVTRPFHAAKVKRANISYAKKKLRENFPIYGTGKCMSGTLMFLLDSMGHVGKAFHTVPI